MFGELWFVLFFFFFQAEDGIRDWSVTGVQTCALPISLRLHQRRHLASVHRVDAAIALGRREQHRRVAHSGPHVVIRRVARSEERRVGKEGRSRRSWWHEDKESI